MPWEMKGEGESTFMPDLPTGTVTFLFTDIEGSVKLWESYPEAMKAILARHDALLRRAIEAHGGYVFKTMGDAFYAAFHTAPDALAAALAAQRALRAENWGETLINVCMALHTGAADERDGDYFGPPLNRVARLLAAGHGGQVLLSLATQELVRDQLPPTAQLRDLGEHRLKDLLRPERVFQLVAPDLPADFPLLHTLNNRSNNLPAQVTPFIGREREVEAARQQLQRPEVRLLTLTGPGGTGKTRLGLQLAADSLENFADGVFFVPLEPITEPALVASAIGQALNVHEVEGKPVLEVLKSYLRERQVLLLLDNFEQTLGAAPVVAQLLAAAPKLKILVTSRTVLHVYGEYDYPVPPLTLPHPKHVLPIERLTQYGAVRLFIERAQAAKADFGITNENAPAVAEICARLDGLPLAIELAAAQVRFLSPQAILARMERRLPLLTGGARNLPARQQTLRGAIAWSYDLLTESEKELFRRVAVFVGGCTPEAAEQVCGGDPSMEMVDELGPLVDQSLLKLAEANDALRFTMLETIREYAMEQLRESGQVEALRQRHAEYFLSFAQAAELQLKGVEQVAWLQRLEADHDNLRAALRWTMEHGEGEWALRLAGALAQFWFMHSHFTEGRWWLGQSLELGHRAEAAGELSPAYWPLRGKALSEAGRMAVQQGDYVAARALHEESLLIWREAGDKSGVAASLNYLGNVAFFQGDLTAARTLHEESLAIRRELGDKRSITVSLNNLAGVARLQGDYAAARMLYEENLAIRRELGDKLGIANTLSNLGMVASFQGDYAAASSLLNLSLAMRRELGDKMGIANSLNNLSFLILRQGSVAAAHALYQESALLRLDIGDKRGLTYSLQGLTSLAAARGQWEHAARLAGATQALVTAINAPLEPEFQAEFDRALTAARAQLDEATFAEAWAKGRAMTLEKLEDAIAYTLENQT